MCQLAAYVGNRPIASLLLRAIENQEPYFGGHASGLAVVDEREVKIEKDFGHVQLVKSKTNIASLQGTMGIAHSRYTSKGRDNPYLNTREMAQPFIDVTGSFALMHMGTITNYRELWDELKGEHKFQSYSEMMKDITDSEVAVHLLSDALKKGMTVEESLKHLSERCQGSHLFCMIHRDHPDTVWIANWHEPCWIAVGTEECMFVTSRLGFYDVKDSFDRVFEPPKNSIIKMTRTHVEISNLNTSKRIPNFKVDPMKLAHEILNLLQKRGAMNIRILYNVLRQGGLPYSMGITKDTYDEWTRQGISILNPYFDTLNMMLAQGVIKEEVKMKPEGGVIDTPRFIYSAF